MAFEAFGSQRKFNERPDEYDAYDYLKEKAKEKEKDNEPFHVYTEGEVPEAANDPKGRVIEPNYSEIFGGYTMADFERDAEVITVESIPGVSDERAADKKQGPAKRITDRDLAQLEQFKKYQERVAARKAETKKAGLWGRVKGWFRKEKPDNRTLEERLQDQEEVVTEILEMARLKLDINPARLNREEVALLSAEEMDRYNMWKIEQNGGK